MVNAYRKIVNRCSNSVYHVYNFGRVGVGGKPRELHIDKAVEVTNLKLKHSGKNGEAEGEPINYKSYDSKLPISNEYFTCIKYDVNGDITLNTVNSGLNSIIVVYWIFLRLRE